MRAHAALALLAAAAFARPAGAGAPPAPPPGWEAPPPLPAAPASTPGKPRAPACCGYDPTCCERQRGLDADQGSSVVRVADVDVSALPEIEIKTAPKEGPPISGAPSVRALDGQGRPAPWPDGPKKELRVMPPGRFGAIKWRRDWSEPFFADPDLRGMGYGIVVATEPYDPRTPMPKVDLSGPVTFTSLDKGSGDRVVYDRVEGSLAGSTTIAATRWEHVEATPVHDGWMYGWRAKVKDDAAVVLLMPEVILRFEALDTQTDGGFFPSRFSRAVPYTRYTLPCGEGRSALAEFDFLRHASARWFVRPPGWEKLPDRRRYVIAASRTTAEPAPRVRIYVFKD